MAYAIDLNKRQSARTLEQAIRHKARIVLEPRVWSDGQFVFCRMEAAPNLHPQGINKNDLLVLHCELDEQREDASGQALLTQRHVSATLLGTYCDVSVPLGEQCYLFSSDVNRVVPADSTHSEVQVFISRPDTVQVAQRRRFRRIQLAHSSKVQILWTDAEKKKQEAIAWLCNLSEDGLACRAEANVADALFIGEQTHLCFTLTPGQSEPFRIDAVLCNKTPAGTQGKIILGLQFVIGADHELSAASIECLRRRLWGNVVDVSANIREGN